MRCESIVSTSRGVKCYAMDELVKTQRRNRFRRFECLPENVLFGNVSLPSPHSPSADRQLPLARQMFANEIWLVQPFASVSFAVHAHTPYSTAWMVFLAPCSARQHKDPSQFDAIHHKNHFYLHVGFEKRSLVTSMSKSVYDALA